MLKKVLVLSAMAIVSTSFAHATTDWTPFLQPMQNGCGTGYTVLEIIPTKYKPSIKKSYHWKKKVKFGQTYDTYDVFTVELKQATAFGKPIVKIEQSTDNYSTHIFELYFADKSFVNLRPQFYFTDDKNRKITYPPNKKGTYLDSDSESGIAGYESNANGYTIQSYGDSSLDFDKKKKSIVCQSST